MSHLVTSNTTSTSLFDNVTSTMTAGLPPGGDKAQQYSVTDILSYFYFIVGGIGLLGNTFVVVVIFSLTSMRKEVTNMFIINQSLIDWLTALLLILGIVFGEEGQILSGVLGEMYCRLWLNKAIQWSTQLASTFNLVAITLERYLAVVHPIKYKMVVSKTKALIAIVLVWLISFLIQLSYAVPPAGLFDGKCNLLRFWPSRAFQRGVGVFLIVIKFFIPLGVMMFCYTKMIMVLKTKIHPTSESEGRNTAAGKRERARKNIFKTLAIVTVCFVACWICNQVYFFLFKWAKCLRIAFLNG